MNDDEKTCPRCAETVKSAALVCRYCGHEFEAPPTTQPPRQFLKPPPPDDPKSTQARNGLLGCLGLIVIVGFIGQCAGGEGGENSNRAALDSTNEALPIDAFTNPSETAEEEAKVPRSNWRTSTSRDEVRGRIIHYAEVTSDNAVNFEFPYAGGSLLTITVRKHPQYGEDVIFQISDGQFVCGVYNCEGAINFGSGPETLTLSRPEDHDSKTLFATYGPAIIRKLKQSERVVVELPFYQEGNRQFTFKTKGLVWPPKG